jgi:hypothetical protein
VPDEIAIESCVSVRGNTVKVAVRFCVPSPLVEFVNVIVTGPYVPGNKVFAVALNERFTGDDVTVAVPAEGRRSTSLARP